MGLRKPFRKLVPRWQDMRNQTVPKEDVARFIKRFRDNTIATDLIRVGDASDGGYLMPDILDSVTTCFSPGVAETATFEEALSRDYNIKSFMADASVQTAPVTGDNFDFIKKFLGSQVSDDHITLGDWVNQNVTDTDNNLLLQMDIEGAEYDVFSFEDSEVLERFSVMVVEFHDLQRLSERYFFQMLSSLFEKLYRSFAICHVHPNNAGGIAKVKDLPVPRLMEITFVRHDIVKTLPNNQNFVLPHPLDSQNLSTKPPITMPDIWWKKANF